MSSTLATIVEGKGEVEALPVLLRRVLEQMQSWQTQVARPFLVKRNQVVKTQELERAIKLVVQDRENVGGILVLLDADDDDPAQLGPELEERCKKAIHLPVAVALANREFESWFLGAKESLRGICRIRPNATAPQHPEEIRGAKERLSQNMLPGSRYNEVLDQPTLAAKFDLAAAQEHCPSFGRFLCALKNLIAEMESSQTLIP